MIIQKGVPELLRRQAAQLYLQAFREKLSPILGSDEQAVDMVAAGLESEHGIVAVINNELIGIAGVRWSQHAFFTLRPFDLIASVGWKSAIRHLALSMMVGERLNEDALGLEGMAVEATWRARGVGTALLKAVIRYAQTNQYRTVWLEVADTNHSARRLYQRHGFIAVRTKQTRWLTHTLGFNAITTMVKVV